MASTLSSPAPGDYTSHEHHLDTLDKSSREYQGSGYISTLNNIVDAVSASGQESFVQEVASVNAVSEEEIFENQDLRLPSRASLFVIIGGNALFQLSFFIIVSSASVYSNLLGGTATFAGLIIGIPTVFSGIGLIFITRLDKGQYAKPFNIAYAAAIVGNVIYALAYRSNWLYMILIGRIVSGFGFISFMYSKRYCSDSRIIGLRRRTTLASWLVVGQAFGFSAGPFFGGLLYKIGFHNKVFNGVTSPGWIMAGIWALFWALSIVIFKDVAPLSSRPRSEEVDNIELSTINAVDRAQIQSAEHAPRHRISPQQWGVIICMCYYAMTCFFILGSWEANIPVFTAKIFGYTPYNAGNFIALGGVTSFPFLFLNVWYARRIQDRVILGVGTSLGFTGVIIMLAILLSDRVTFGSLFVCWFLVALGFNLASTCTLSLLSKQLPGEWNNRVSMAIQYSNYTGRVTGAILGGAGVKIGMVNYAVIQIVVVALGGVMYMTLWRQLKAKTG